MEQQVTLIDAEAFARTSQLFAAKRQALAPDTVTVLVGDIVRRLARAAQDRPRSEEIAVGDESLAAFCHALVQPEPTAALRFVEQRRAEGVSRQTIYIGYIAAAAGALGDAWDQNRLTSTEVITGTGHLYALMRALRGEGIISRPAFDSRKYALFATVPDEDHSIGITIAADLFRDAGWEIDLQIGKDHDALVERIDRARPSIIGLSLSTENRLASLVRLVVAIRLTLPEAIIGIAPAAAVDETKLDGLVDFDLLFRDARASCVELDRLIQLRG